MKIIGIDLGTTNSLVSVWKDGKVELIPNAFGEYLTPSIVSFDDNDTVYVGKTAKERLITNPLRTFEFFKRGMGRNKKYWKYSAEELSSFVLRSLKADAERYLGEKVEEAVISVPAYFDDKARNATKYAGELAGLKVNRIINEPSAAALGYLRGNGSIDTDSYEDKTLLVFDFGGGTLDVSLVETFDNVVEILSVSGDNVLGGIDFDKAIADHFLSEKSIDKDKLKDSEYNSILDSAEKVKKKLTDEPRAVMQVRTENYKEDYEIRNKDLATICMPVLKRLYKPIHEVLKNAGCNIESITDIVMVGGSSKMPLIKHYMEYTLDRKDIKISNPDYMIAVGMGVYAGIKERDEEVKNIVLTDVCPFSLGTDVYNKINPNRPLSSFIIPRNSALPISRTGKYRTLYENQQKITVQIFQGEERYVDENKKLGEIEFELPLHTPCNTEVIITFTYDINGILVVDVDVPSCNIKKNSVIVNSDINYSQEEIESKTKELEKIKQIANDDEEIYQILEWGSRLYTTCSNEARVELENRLRFYEERIIRETDLYQKKKISLYMRRFLLFFEMAMLKETNGLVEIDDSWMEIDDRDIEDMYKDWDGEDK